MSGDLTCVCCHRPKGSHELLVFWVRVGAHQRAEESRMICVPCANRVYGALLASESGQR